MATHLWKRVKSGTPSARVFSAYLALVLMVAVMGPGLAVYGSEGNAPVELPVEVVEPVGVDEAEPVPVVEPEPVVVPEVVPEPVIEPVIVPTAEAVAHSKSNQPVTPEPVVGVAAAAVMSPLALSSDPSDLGIVPETVAGNPKLCIGGIRVDNGTPGSYAIPGHPGMFVTVSVTQTEDGPVFSFTSDVPVTRVVAKGGRLGANIYYYDPTVMADGGLHTPVNPSGFYAGISHIDFCFGEIPDPEGELIVYKFHDLDEDGIFDEGEPMLEGWEFTLTQSTPPVIATQAIQLIGSGLTDASGELLFGELVPGEYTATETLKEGWTNTTPLAQDVMVVAGQTAELWFGNVEIPDEPEGDLAVHKFHDLDEDGVFDEGEPMLEGWEFTLEHDAPQVFFRVPSMTLFEVVGSGMTDADGHLHFGALVPGEYTVTETLQEGWTNTTPLSQDVTVVDGPTAHLWFGNVEIPEPEGDLIVYKFEDLDEDGIHDEGEPMLEGWEFTLTAGEATVDSGLTDENGELVFSELALGEYTVTETLQEGWTNTTPLAQVATVVEEPTAELWFGNVEEFLPFTELDLAITKSVNKATADPGELLTYTLTYWNTSDVVAYDFTITDDYDQRYVTVVNAAGGTVADGKIVWTLAGPLDKADGKQTITYTVRVVNDMPDGTTNVDNVVVIRHPDDTDPSNNTDDARTVVRVGEPFLPFTGGEYLLLIGLAALAASAGAVLRLRGNSAA
ncbi:MAG: SdrD B-like domain-containing protein [Coriobacteriia bacterium]|nr:SdrD B-like domain-containing protein [Coriobacteriia bacterium]